VKVIYVSARLAFQLRRLLSIFTLLWPGTCFYVVYARHLALKGAL